MTASTSQLPEPVRSRARHIPALDGLRGTAILLVVMLHATEAFGRVHPVQPVVGKVLNVGFTGVDLFFVLSGFLISGILLASKGSPSYFRVFYIRRTLRIFPLYYAYLALIFVVLPLVSAPIRNNYSELRAHQLWYWTYLGNFLNAMQGGWRMDGALTTHFWSLAVEEQFYLLWPTVVLFLSFKSLRNLCIAIIIATPFLRLGLRVANVNPIAVYVLTICRADALALGALIAVTLRTDSGRALVRRYAMTALIVAAIALAAIGAWRHGFGQFDIVIGTIGYSVWAAFYGALLSVAVTMPPRGEWIAALLSARWLRFFGKYSYAMYVFHRPLSGLAEDLWIFGRGGGALTSTLEGIGFVVTVLIASTVAALCSWWLLERRFIALKDRIPYGRARKDQVAYAEA
jgi:peptidoglycan/LPS O-acetylase OafA/YrhL